MRVPRRSRSGATEQRLWALLLGVAAAIGILLITLAQASASAAGPTTPDRWIYVTNLQNNTVAVIDGNIDARTHRIASTVSVGHDGTNPFGIAVTPHAIYVANQGANSLSVINPRTLTIEAAVTTGSSPVDRKSGGQPYGVAVTPGADAPAHHQLCVNPQLLGL